MSLEEKVAKLETAMLIVTSELTALKSTVEALSAIIYRREAPVEKVTTENVLEGLSPQLKELLDVGEHEGEIRVCMKRWIPDRSKWTTINKFLREQKGLQWHSQGKDSLWSKGFDKEDSR